MPKNSGLPGKPAPSTQPGGPHKKPSPNQANALAMALGKLAKLDQDPSAQIAANKLRKMAQ